MTDLLLIIIELDLLDKWNRLDFESKEASLSHCTTFSNQFFGSDDPTEGARNEPRKIAN